MLGWLLSRPGQHIGWNIALGILGVFSGSLALAAFGLPGVTGYNVYSFIVSLLGASTVISLAWAIQRLPLSDKDSLKIS
jgi:uncharacterized membrane protein YeaQ/YmgE (transglycosylase-associated protein family)